MKTYTIITGANGLIGQSLVERFAKAGHNIIMVYYPEYSHEWIDKLIKEYNLDIICLPINLLSRNEIQDNLLKFIINNGLVIDNLINNAGLRPERKDISATSWNEIDNQIAINFTSVVLLTKEIAEFMSKTGGGNIINMSSEAARFGGNRIAIYAATKAALSCFTVASAREYGKYNIRINALSPGVVAAENELLEDAIVNSIALARAGYPKDIANLAYFLTTEEASYITGSVIPINGGR